jgi:hypothetical protein
MERKTRKSARKQPTRGPWLTALVEMAAAGRDDGGLGLHDLLQKAGFSEEPSMTVIVKRPRALFSDPSVDDALDALRALCA